MTPVSASEILWAELLWGATKGLLSCTAIACVARLLNIYHTWFIIPAFLILFLISFLGAVCGLLFTTFAKSYDFFNYAISGFLLPISFFSDTYFPIDQIPLPGFIFIHLLPLVHGVKAVRHFLNSGLDKPVFFHVIALIVFAFLLTRWTYIRFRRLILD